MRGIRNVILLGVLLSGPVLLGPAGHGQTSGLARARPAMERRVTVQAPIFHVPQSGHVPQTGRKAIQPEAARYHRNLADDYSAKDRKYRFKLDTISVGASYSHFSGPFHGYPYDSYPYYPYYLNPFWAYSRTLFAPGYFVGYARGPGKGEVKLTADARKASVYLDGGYAGTAEALKSMWLNPGAYDLVVMAWGHLPYRQRLYVRSGKTLKVSVALASEAGR